MFAAPAPWALPAIMWKVELGLVTM